MSEDQPKRIVEHLEKRRPQMLELLELLVRAESPSDEPSTQARMLGLLSDAFVERGFRPRIIAGKRSGGMLLAMPMNRARRRPHQLVLGHC
ncbi:MAG: hypothetical protein OES69_12190, partial [Myxococcales bacterium]|nr:hypothetical protein [Myxococcales bacterium]